MAMRIAARLQNRQIAEWLLAPFPIAALSPPDVTSLLALIGVFGEDFCTGVLEQWMHSSRSRWTGHWIEQLPAIVAELTSSHAQDEDRASASRRIARSLVRHQWETYEALELRPWRLPSRTHSAEQRKTLQAHMLDLLECSRLLDDPELEQQMLNGLREHLGDPDHIATLARLCIVPEKETRSRRVPIELRPLADPTIAGLQRLLEQPEREEDDWRIDPPGNCDCELCTELAAFLRARSRSEYSWPLAKPRRQHIHQQIDRHRLPVRHRTVRTGRPYTLVLTKTKELFKRDRARRREWEKSLAALTEKFGTVP
jgi:hypothetical protein